MKILLFALLFTVHAQAKTCDAELAKLVGEVRAKLHCSSEASCVKYLERFTPGALAGGKAALKAARKLVEAKDREFPDDSAITKQHAEQLIEWHRDARLGSTSGKEDSANEYIQMHLEATRVGSHTATLAPLSNENPKESCDTIRKQLLQANAGFNKAPEGKARSEAPGQIYERTVLGMCAKKGVAYNFCSGLGTKLTAPGSKDSSKVR